MNDDQADILAAMYGDPPEKPGPAPLKPLDAISGDTRKSRRVVMGAVKYDVPTVEYVDTLERRITQQDRLIIQQTRTIRRLELSLIALTNSVRRTGGSLTDVSRELSNKIDRRD